MSRQNSPSREKPEKKESEPKPIPQGEAPKPNPIPQSDPAVTAKGFAFAAPVAEFVFQQQLEQPKTTSVPVNPFDFEAVSKEKSLETLPQKKKKVTVPKTQKSTPPPKKEDKKSVKSDSEDELERGYERIKGEPEVKRYYDACLEMFIEELLTGKKPLSTPWCDDRFKKYKYIIEQRSQAAAKLSFNGFLYDWGNHASFPAHSELKYFDKEPFMNRFKMMQRMVSQDRRKVLQRTVAYLQGVSRWNDRKPSSAASTESNASSAKQEKTPREKGKNKENKPSEPKPPQPPKNTPSPSSDKPVVPPKTVATPKKPEEKSESFSSISAWAGTLQPTICSADKDAIIYAKSRGIQFKTGKTALNGHSISAMERHQAMRAFLQIAGRDLRHMTICSYFGSNRDMRFQPADPDCSIKWICAPDDAIQGDNAREFSARVAMPYDVMFDTVVFVDVYQSGPSHLDVISPETIKDLILKTTSGHVYGILRKFHGLAGADVFAIEEDSKTHHKVEGVWIQKDKLIYFSPDAGGSAYPGHPNPTWLTQRHCKGVDVHEVQNFGPYVLYKFALSLPHAQTIDNSYLIEPRVTLKEISKEVIGEHEGNFVSTVMSTIRSWCPTMLASYLPEAVKIVVPVHTQTYSSFAVEYSVKKMIGLTLDTAITKVRTSVEQDKIMLAVKTRYPNFVSELVTGTAMAVLYASKQSVSEQFMIGRQITVDSEDVVDSLRQPKIEKSSFGPKLMVLLSLLAFGVFIRKLLMMRAANHATGDFANSFDIFKKSVTLICEKLNPSQVLRAAGMGNELAIYTDPTPKPTEWPMLQSYLSGNRSNEPFNYYAFFFLCVCTPLLEEIIKQKAPRLALVMFTFESIVNATSFGLFNAAIISSMHILTYIIGKKKLLPAMLIHGLTNFTSLYLSYHYQTGAQSMNRFAASNVLNCLRGQSITKLILPTGSFVGLVYKFLTESRQQTPDVFSMFKEAYDNKQPIDTSIKTSVSIPVNTEFLPIQSSEYPTSPDRGFMKIWAYGIPFEIHEIKDLMVFEKLPKTTHKIHPLLINNGLMYTPANSMNNLLACLLYRIHKEPFRDCPPKEERLKNWRKLVKGPLAQQFYQYFRALEHHELSVFPTMEEVVKIMGQKGRRIEVCNKRLMEGEEMPPSKSYNVKWNETIPLKELVPGVYDLKPRAICNLDPSIITFCTQLSRYITNVCHQVFNGKNSFNTIYGDLKICFASGYTQYELSRMHTLMLASENFLAVAGDDSICKVTDGNNINYIENDFSHFDQSQDDGPNRVGFAIWMKEIGVAVDIIDAIIWIFAKGYKVAIRGSRPYALVGSGGLQLPTGHPLTTVLNSLNDIWSYLSAWQTKPFNFTAAARKLGFTAKVKDYMSDYQFLTFLKGWWLPTNIGYVWMPLPSAVLKIGKFLKPLSYFSRKTLEDPIPMCAAMIVNSYFGVDRDYPILGDFLRTLDRFKSEKFFESSEVNENEFKPRLLMENYKIDYMEAEYLIHERYGLEYNDFQEITELYAQIKKLPAYVQHPAFEKMKRVDYM